MQVPEGWEVKKLGNVIKLSSGKTKPKDIVDLSSELYPYPVYGGNNIIGYSEYKNSENQIVLVGRVGEYCGVTRFIDSPCWITDNALYTSEIDSSVDTEYLSLCLIKYDLSRLRNKGGQPLISQKPIYGLKLAFPPIFEQIRIAEILSTWDKAITTTEQLIANSQQQKKALMQQLLTGKKRLLDDNGVRFSGEWKKIKFNKLIKEVKKEKVDNPNSIELLTVRLHYKGVVRTGKFPNATERGRPYFKRYAGELIIGRQNLHNGGIAIVSEECSGLIASNAISSFEVKKSSNINFILSIMSTNRFRFTVDSLAGGTGQKEIGVKDLLSLSVIVPDLEEQKKISAVLTSADEEIESLQQKIEALKQEKKALMQQLLTGKRRVKLN